MSEQNEEPYSGVERRVGWPSHLDADFWQRLYNHMTDEDTKFLEGRARMDRIEEDLRPIKKMYWAVVGSAGIGTLMLMLLLYIYAADKAEFKDVQKAILIQGAAIERLMVTQQTLESSYRRDMDRLERGQDKIIEQGGRRNSR
jgi:hypothetical protein